jgi:uncharacterized protein (DUF849 family)
MPTMKTVMVRYTTKPECAADNEALVKRVFDALAKDGPPGLRYQTMREADGNTFVHVATRPDTAEGSPLTQVEAFRQFVAGIKERCVEPPMTVEMRILGTYDSTKA